MKRNHRKAFTALKKIGCPLYEGGYNDDKNESFRISAEHNETEQWAEYYDFGYGEFGVKQEVCDILRSHGLYPEWINPGVLAVCDI